MATKLPGPSAHPHTSTRRPGRKPSQRVTAQVVELPARTMPHHQLEHLVDRVKYGDRDGPALATAPYPDDVEGRLTALVLGLPARGRAFMPVGISASGSLVGLTERQVQLAWQDVESATEEIERAVTIELRPSPHWFETDAPEGLEALVVDVRLR